MKKGKEKRRYFRISDRVWLKLTPLATENLDERIREFHDVGPNSTRHDGGEQERVQLQVALAKIKLEQPEVAFVLETMQRQIERIGSRSGVGSNVFAEVRPMEVDLSAQGVAFDTGQRFPPGEMVELHIKFSVDGDVIRILARVVRCHELPDSTEDCRIALDFEHILEADRQTIMQHILNIQRQALLNQKVGNATR